MCDSSNIHIWSIYNSSRDSSEAAYRFNECWAEQKRMHTVVRSPELYVHSHWHVQVCNNVWPTCDLSMTHLYCNLWPICDSSVTYPVTQVQSIFDTYVTCVRLVCDQFVTHPLTHIWPVCNASNDSYMMHLLS